MEILLMNLLGIIVLVCVGIVVYGFRMKSTARRSKVLKIGIGMLCLFIFGEPMQNLTRLKMHGSHPIQKALVLHRKSLQKSRAKIYAH